MKKILLMLALNVLYANNSYYEHKISQFKLFVKQEQYIMMLGDSITDRGLWNELTLRNDISNRGINGDTIDGVLKRLKNINQHTHQVFIMIGINDILENKSVMSIFDTYKQILLKLKSKNITPIIQSTLYVGEKAPRHYNKEVRKLNFLLQDYAKEKHIQYIDLNIKLAPKGFLLKEYSLDGLHLNGQAYMLWTQIIKKYFFIH